MNTISANTPICVTMGVRKQTATNLNSQLAQGFFMPTIRGHVAPSYAFDAEFWRLGSKVQDENPCACERLVASLDARIQRFILCEDGPMSEDIILIRTGQEKKIVALEIRDNGLKCHYCHCPLSRWHTLDNFFPCRIFTPTGYKGIELDHKVPKSKGGSGRLYNLVLACPDCNRKKSNRYSYEEFMEMMKAARL